MLPRWPEGPIGIGATPTVLGSSTNWADAAAPEARLEHRQLISGEELVGSLQRCTRRRRDLVLVIERALEF